MAIPHARPGEAIDVRPLGPRLAGERTTALFKAGHLEVMRLVLPRSKALPPHAVAGDITVHCLEGRIDVTADGSSHVLEAGQLLYLLAGVSHSVVALEDSTALVTVALVSRSALHSREGVAAAHGARNLAAPLIDEALTDEDLASASDAQWLLVGFHHDAGTCILEGIPSFSRCSG